MTPAVIIKMKSRKFAPEKNKIGVTLQNNPQKPHSTVNAFVFSIVEEGMKYLLTQNPCMKATYPMIIQLKSTRSIADDWF
jgi:hypothetical protein